MGYEYKDMTNMVDVIREIVRDEFAQLMKKENIEKCYNGIVKSVSSDNKTATVDLDFTITELIPNLTGKTLVVGNHVKVFSEMTTLGDAYIGVQIDEHMRNHYEGVIREIHGDFSLKGQTAIVDLTFLVTGLIPNFAGVELAVGNKVIVYSEMTTLRDAYIGLKLNA